MRMTSERTTVRLSILSVCVICAVMLTACGSSELKADISEYSTDAIVIAGLTDDEFTVTPDDLAKMKFNTASGSGGTEKAGTVSAVGPTLETFLAEYGKTLSDISLVRFFASDAYRITLRQQTLQKSNIILSIANGAEPLPASQRPMRIFSPDLESNQWIYAVIRIEFEPA